MVKRIRVIRLMVFRKRQSKLRGKLQAKGTKAAKRLLVKRSRKERRFATNINHTIAKSIVAKAKDTGRGIALEELSGIRDRITASAEEITPLLGI